MWDLRTPATTFLVAAIVCINIACTDHSETLAKFDVPIWTEADLDWHTKNVRTQIVFSSSKPPYFDGGELTYEIGRTPGGVLFFHQFENHQNQFVEPISAIKGARSIDRKTGRLLAEARVRYFVDSGRQGRELEEFHYGPDGKLAFYCKSTIDPSSRFKTDEYRGEQERGAELLGILLGWQ